MPPPRAGQLDEISKSIGRLEGMIEGIQEYNKSREHGIRDMTQAVNGVGTLISREVGHLEGKLKADFEKLGERVDHLSERVDRLEDAQSQEEGAKSVILAIFKSPLIAWFVAIAGGAWAILTGKVHP